MYVSNIVDSFAQLPIQALVEGLAAALAIENEKHRAEALAALLPCFAGVAAQPVRKDYQAAILAVLRAVENKRGTEVLDLLADKNVFTPDALGLNLAAVARIAEAVLDVCRRWEWL
ncbi:MAG: hypothetical protein JXA21_04705 [Anaerolineae bacterium]|mgnify:CR=1 FL=1|nr:hypothetical protein [Anaerolineae bacterium]